MSSVFETIKNRRSMGKMTPERPSRQQIERLLEAASHAPNHHNAQPWKFIVLAGSAREELGALMAAYRGDGCSSAEYAIGCRGDGAGLYVAHGRRRL